MGRDRCVAAQASKGSATLPARTTLERGRADKDIDQGHHLRVGTRALHCHDPDRAKPDHVPDEPALQHGSRPADTRSTIFELAHNAYLLRVEMNWQQPRGT